MPLFLLVVLLSLLLPRSVGQQLQCPVPNATFSADRRKFQEKMQTHYNSYAKTKCAQGIDNWWAFDKADHDIIAHDIFDALQPKPGDFIFEWGTGCGTKLRYLVEHYPGTRGFGVDISEVAILYAQARARDENCTALTFCFGDGMELSWVPDKTFDHAFTFGGLTMIAKTQYSGLRSNALCAVVGQLVRAVKPGGRLFIGANLQHPLARYYQSCVDNLKSVYGPLTIRFITEWDMHAKYLKPVVSKGRRSLDRIGRAYWGPGNNRGYDIKRIYTAIVQRGT